MKILLTAFVLNLILISNVIAEWEECNLPYEGGNITSLSNHGERIAYIMEENELHLSEDNGDTWTQIPFEIEVSKMACVTINQNNIFLVADSSLYVSTNLGSSWALNLYGMVLKYGRTIFCYNDSIFVSIKGGLAKSFDNGESWTWQGLPFTPTDFCKSDDLMVVTSGSNIIYSWDVGNTWNDANFPQIETPIYTINIIHDKVFVGGEKGLFSSDDNFETWYNHENKLPHSYINDIKVLGERVYIAYDNYYGVYSSDNLGEDWALMGDKVDDYVNEIAVNEKRIFIGTQKVGLIIYEIEKDIWLRYGKSKSFLSSCGTIGDYIFCTTGIGFMYSNNNGMDWAFNNFAASLNDILVIDSTLYITLAPFVDSFRSYEYPFSKIGVIKSTDYGVTWEALNDGIGFMPPEPIAYSNGTLFTGSISGIYRSKNLGINWEKVEGFGNWNYIASIVNIDSTILVGYFQNISVSHDFGETWSFVKDGFYGGTYFFSIIGNKTFIRYAYIRWGYYSRQVIGISYDNGKTFDLDYERDNVPYIYTGNSNISFEYVDDRTIFSDDGVNWYDVEAGLISPAHYIITKDDYFIVQTMDGDLYRIEIEKLKQLTHVQSQDKQARFSIHPNPASEYIEINLDRWTPLGSLGSSGRWSPSEIKIFNTLGECVKNLTPTAHPSTGSGSDNLRIDISHLPRGVYYLRIGSRTLMFVKT